MHFYKVAEYITQALITWFGGKREQIELIQIPPLQ